MPLVVLSALSEVDKADAQKLMGMTYREEVKQEVLDAIYMRKIEPYQDGKCWYNSRVHPSLDEARGSRRQDIIRYLDLEAESKNMEARDRMLGIAREMPKAQKTVQIKNGVVVRCVYGQPDEVLSERFNELSDCRYREAERLYLLKQGVK